jgi:hypothetical protein
VILAALAKIANSGLAPEKVTTSAALLAEWRLAITL